MRGWLWLGMVVASMACSASGGDKSDTDRVDDTDGGAEDTDVAVDDTDVSGDTDGACLAADDLGELTLSGADVIVGDSWYTVYKALNDDALPDFFQVELYGGTEQFPGLPETGEFELTGANAQYSTCGVCVLLLADVDADGIPAQVFLATGGTVTLTAIDSTVSGTYADLVFEEVEIDPDSHVSTPAGDCASGSSSGSFSAVLPR